MYKRQTAVCEITQGYGRGSSELGIPTANVARENGKIGGLGSSSFDELPTGIYWGFCRIGTDAHVYKTACSIGFNPTYGNKTKTVEPHLIAPKEDDRRHKSSCGESILGDFYDQTIRLTLVGYLRPELPFEGLEKLIQAIKNDITETELLAEDSADETAAKEKAWVGCESGV